MTYRRILFRSLVCIACVLGLSAAGLALNLWLGFQQNLGGNLAVVVITALLLELCSGSSLSGNMRLTLYFSILGGIGAVFFLVLLGGLSPLGAYSFDPLSSIEVALAFQINTLAFFITVRIVLRRSRKA